jgi:hypothetical protein
MMAACDGCLDSRWRTGQATGGALPRTLIEDIIKLFN